MRETGTCVIQDGVLEKYSGSAEIVTIPEEVREIGAGAFDGCRTLRQVVFPSGLEHIGANAFKDCCSLEAAILPPKTKTVDVNAFAYCGKLKTLWLPPSLKDIGGGAFRGCGSLTAVSLPEGVREICFSAFEGCTELESVSLPEGLECIGPCAFAECGRLESVSLPMSLRQIGNRAFQNCGSLRNVALPGKGVRFYGGSFLGCPGLADGEGFIIMDGVLLQYVGGGGAVTVPAGVRAVGDHAFVGCRSLTAVSLPEGLRSIGYFAFNNCEALESVFLPESLREIKSAAFWNCRSLRLLRLPEGLRSLGTAAFRDCKSLRTLRLPEGLKQLRLRTFEGCEALESVSLPDSLRWIGEEAFGFCKSLRTLRLPEGPLRMGKRVFAGCEGLADEAGRLILRGRLTDYFGPGGDVTVPEGVTHIEDRAFSGNAGLTGVSLPESLESIGDRAFSGCGSLRSVSFPKRPVRFGCRMFCDSPKLTGKDGFFTAEGVLFRYAGPGGDVTVPEGVTRIDSQALADLPGTLRLSLPDSVKFVAKDAFRNSSLILRVRRWFPDLTRAVRSCDLRAILTETDKGLPSALRRAARFGSVLWPEAVFDAGKSEEDAVWLGRHAEALFGEVLRQPELGRFLCGRRLIPPGCVDVYLEEARKRNSPELTARLLDYLNALGPETVARAREARQAREEAEAEARARRLAAWTSHQLPRLHIAPDERVDHRFWDCRSMTELKKHLPELGAVTLQTEINSRTDYLLSDDPDGGSARFRKAAALGIPVVSSEELLDILWR